MINTILVVCIGNICRSPMAEGLLKRALPEKIIWSAGIEALVGHSAAPFSVEIMQEHAIDLSAHRAQNIASWMVRQADLILTMDQFQKKHIESVYSLSKGKVFRLGKTDIPDPYRENVEMFRRAFSLIDQGVHELVKHFFLPI